MNNLVSNAIFAGQKLKLPMQNEQKNNKNHIDINHVTKNGFESLAGDQRKPSVFEFKQKNTNPRGYTIDG
jgi:LysM repeat protein